MNRLVFGCCGLACAWLLGASTAEAEIRSVAVLGDAPFAGESLVIKRVRNLAVIGENSAFYTANATTGEDLIAIDVGGTDTLIAVQGRSAPGGGTFSQLSAVVPGGTIATFKSGLAGSAVIYGWSVATGVRRLVAEGEPVNGGSNLGVTTILGASPSGHVLIVDNLRLLRVDLEGTVDVIARMDGPVPGNASYTVSVSGATAHYSAQLADDGTVTLNTKGAITTAEQDFLIQGTPGNWTTINQSGNYPQPDRAFLYLLGASPGGTIVYAEYWQTGTGVTGDPAIHHVAIQRKGAGGTTTLHEFESEDEDTRHRFTVAGRELFVPTSVRVSDSGLVVAETTTVAGTLRSVIAYTGGGWQKVAFGDELLPGSLNAQEPSIAGFANDTAILAPLTVSLGVWSWNGSLARVAGPSDLVPAGIHGNQPAVGVSGAIAAPIARDGTIGFTAGYADPDGGTTVGAFMMGNGGSTGKTTDLAIEYIGVTRTVGVGNARVYRSGFRIRNNGTETVSARVSIVTDGGMFELEGCVGGTCTAVDVPGGGSASVEGTVFGDFGTTVNAMVVPLDAEETMPDDNTIEFTYEAPKDSDGSCNAGGGSGLLVALSMVRLFRRRARLSA